jgi:hypothetical protein
MLAKGRQFLEMTRLLTIIGILSEELTATDISTRGYFRAGVESFKYLLL